MSKVRTAFASIRALKVWQIALILIVLVGASIGIYSIFNTGSASGQAGLTEDQQLMPVRSGTLTNSVSINGSITFSRKEALGTEIEATVEEILVERGQSVTQGQTLARLDANTITMLERDVAQAQLDLRDAREGLDDLLNPPPEAIAEVESSIASYRIDVLEAQDALEEDIASAQRELENARTELENARRHLRLVESGISVQSQQDDLEDVENDYNNVFKKWLGINLTEDELGQSPQALFDAWGVDLDSLFDVHSHSFSGSPQDDPDTRWSEVTLYGWLRLYPGVNELVPTCTEDDFIPERSTCILREFEEAWEPYKEALDQTETTVTEHENELSSARDAVASSERNVREAQEALEILQSDMGADQRSAELALAQANLQAAQEELDQLLDPPPEEVALREAEVALGQATLKQAQELLQEARMVAPFDGVVTSIGADVGEEVSAEEAVVEVTDTSSIVLEGTVDEIDVLSLSEGARAVVTMDALPGRTLNATVVEIASAANSEQGVVTYPITIEIEQPQDLELREGLSAVANVILNEASGIMIPNNAIRGSFDQPVVRVWSDGQTEDRPVSLGFSDGLWTIVESGLSEGEQIVVESRQGGFPRFGGPVMVDPPAPARPAPSSGSSRGGP